MFGFSWAEIGLIMAVALIAIGPKDLPVAIRTVTAMMKKARGMASEFQGHVDEMMRDANLSEVKQEIDKLRRFDFKSAAENAIDPDGTLRQSVTRPFDVPNAGAAMRAAAAASETGLVSEAEAAKMPEAGGAETPMAELPQPVETPEAGTSPVAEPALVELASVYEMGAGPSFVPAPVVEEALVDAPAFIPPEAARKSPVPDFIPPGTTRWGY
jgi:sec-independent protein translocase protein TatB